MLKGRYKKRVDYTHLRAFLFNPSLYCPLTYGETGCGATALSLITGDHPWDIQDLNKKRPHYADRFMVKYLKNKGFTVTPITQKSVTSCRSDQYPVTSNHVILISQLMIKREATWVVYHRNIGYHNYVPGSHLALDFVNKPILTSYIIWHPRFSASRNLSCIKPKKKA